MCVNCAAAGSSYVVGAAAAAKALGPKGLVGFFRPRRWRTRERHPSLTAPAPAAQARTAPAPFVAPPPKREWVTYAVGLAVYVAAGVTWPRLLDPVLGPLFLLIAIHVVPARARRMLAVRRARHAPVPANNGSLAA